MRHFISSCWGLLMPGDITQQKTSPGGILKTKPPISLMLQVFAELSWARFPSSDLQLLELMKIWSGPSWTETPVFPIVSRIDSKFLQMSTQPFTSTRSYLPPPCQPNPSPPATSLTSSCPPLALMHPYEMLHIVLILGMNYPIPSSQQPSKAGSIFYLHSTHEKKKK